MMHLLKRCDYCYRSSMITSMTRSCLSQPVSEGCVHVPCEAVDLELHALTAIQGQTAPNQHRLVLFSMSDAIGMVLVCKALDADHAGCGIRF